MGKATRRNLLAHKLRLGLTVLAIALGVALVAGTLTLTGAMTAARAGPPAADQPDLVVRGPALDALSGRSPERQAPRQPLEEAVAGRVAGVDGVAAVRGVVHRPVTLLGAGGAPVAAAGEPTLGVSLSQADGLEPQASLAEGRLPGGGEAVLDATSARALDLAIGGRVEVVGADGRAQAFTISGIVGAAGRGGELAGRVAGFDLPTAQRLLGRAGQLDEVQVAAAPGSDPEALRRRVAAALRRGPEVDTGAAVERQQRAERDREVRSVRQTMLWFVLVALLIGGFLVANAFSIMVAQRTRELALLRCLGATTGQVRNAVLLEALVVGVAASLLGTLAGPLVAAALARQLSRLGGGAAPGAGLGPAAGPQGHRRPAARGHAR